jgi:hypothetical protein
MLDGGPASTNRRVGQVSYDELGCGRAVDAGMQDECAARRPRGAEVDLGPPLPCMKRSARLTIAIIVTSSL